MANYTSFRKVKQPDNGQNVETDYYHETQDHQSDIYYTVSLQEDKCWREIDRQGYVGQDRGMNFETLLNGFNKAIIPPWKSSLKVLYRNRGVLWAIFCILNASFCSLCVKLLAGIVPPSQLLFFRGIFQILFTAPYIVRYRLPMRYPPKMVLLILARGIIGTFLSFMCYYSYQAIPVATAKALIYSSPFFVAIFAGLCLKEHCSLWTTFFSLLTVISVVLVVQPPFIFGSSGDGETSIVGLMCAVVGAVTMAANVIVLRYMQMLRIHAQVIIFVYGFIAAICSAIFQTTGLEKWTNPGCGLERLIIIVMCLTGFLEQVSGTLALKTQKASVISIIRGNDVIVSFIFELLIFDMSPGAWTIVGVFGVVGSAIGMTVSSHFASKRDKEKEMKHKIQDDLT
ncbi:solute carrier family 35 member G1-like [Strongylocentrotus purpuratus]|uniref:EamA domain-containing protein n=1 Tax=Strongylocentrotus purpuratus TaxID=7668 RepID=A0A7M7PM99_STRPU|nr:solute carrier family 35 member G1-like [Strongylocentrotus purpuratus]